MFVAVSEKNDFIPMMEVKEEKVVEKIELENMDYNEEPCSSASCNDNELVPDENEDSSNMEEISEFVNKFDLNSLVLIESQVDGKTVQDVHTVNRETDEISKEPIQCPEYIKEFLIISMAGGNEDDDE